MNWWLLGLLTISMVWNYFMTIAWWEEKNKNAELEGMRKEIEKIYKNIDSIAKKKPKFLSGKD